MRSTHIRLQVDTVPLAPAADLNNQANNIYKKKIFKLVYGLYAYT